MSTTAKINARGCTGTGITEDIAKDLHDHLGSTIIIVAELTSENRTENRKGDEKVNLVLNNIEVAPDGMAAEHVRELSRSFHYERKLAQDSGQGTIPGTLGDGVEPKVSEVLEAGQRHRPHPFIPDDAAKDNPICDVCGKTETARVHDAAQRTDDNGADVDLDDDGQPQLEEPDAPTGSGAADEPWEYADGEPVDDPEPEPTPAA